jgi:hypothetical protein
LHEAAVTSITENSQPLAESPEGPFLLRATGNAGEYIVRVSGDHMHRADDYDEDYGKHHGVLRNVLTDVRRGSVMKSETKRRLRSMSDTEKEKRLDELNRKLRITRPNEPDPEEIEEREWLKKKLGYKQR